MRTVDQYVGLIAPEHSNQPNFVATVSLSVQPLADMQVLLAALCDTTFDLDKAIGVQLDAVGLRVGRTRFLPYPLQGIFFSWDDPLRGWDKGIWQGPYDTALGIYQLDDDTYRRLLRAKIAANHWDGTTPGAQAILDIYFNDPDTYVFVQDDGWNIVNNFFSWDDPLRGWDAGYWKRSTDTLIDTPLDMSMTIGVAGKLPSLIDLGLLGQGAFPVKPEGVTLNYAVTSIDSAPVFGFDIQNQYISGWDSGAWGVSPDYIALNNIVSTADVNSDILAVL